MTEIEMIRMIKTVVRQELAPILMGQIVSNKDQMYSSATRLAESPIPSLRSVLPYGFSSRAPAGTAALVTPIAGDPTNLCVTGHFDSARPALNDGEVILYDQFGHQVYLSQSKMQFGSQSSAENMVLGQQLNAFLSNLLTLIANHTHPGIGYPPDTMAQFNNLNTNTVEANDLISAKCFTEK